MTGHTVPSTLYGLMLEYSVGSYGIVVEDYMAVNTATTSNTIVFSLIFGTISAAGTGTVLTTALGTMNTPTNLNAAVPKSFTSMLENQHAGVKASKMTLRGAWNSLLREKDRPERGPRAGQNTKSTFAAYVAQAWPVEVRMVSAEISRR
ncbi:hypothetical protein B0H11DRAFT_1906090 [Mycena galericulata]|nr:hypothetical protein B0H11DRAFT_1906090 [Mycena galericulata]